MKRFLIVILFYIGATALTLAFIALGMTDELDRTPPMVQGAPK